MKKILIRNDTHKIFVISGKTKLGRVVKYKADGCYKAHINAVGTAPINPQRLAIGNLMAFDSLAESNKMVFNNKTTGNGEPDTVGKLAEVAKQFKLSL